MIPPKNDPRWKQLVSGNEQFPLKGLAVRMMLTRARLMGARRDAKSVQEAIDTAHEFFVKNVDAAREDIRTLFGGEKP